MVAVHRIGDKGAAALVKMLAKNSKLRKLNLGSNVIGQEMQKALLAFDGPMPSDVRVPEVCGAVRVLCTCACAHAQESPAMHARTRACHGCGTLGENDHDARAW